MRQYTTCPDIMCDPDIRHLSAVWFWFTKQALNVRNQLLPKVVCCIVGVWVNSLEKVVLRSVYLVKADGLTAYPHVMLCE